MDQSYDKTRLGIKKAKGRKHIVRFTKLGHYSDFVVKVYTDASYNNQDGNTRSTDGRVVLVEGLQVVKVS